jgi:hypothetical protein
VDAVVSEMTPEEALRAADALVGQALKESAAWCSLLAQFVDDCDRGQAHTSAWSEALRELHALHGHRSGLIGRRSLIQQALDCPVGENSTEAPLSPARPGPHLEPSDRFRFKPDGGGRKSALSACLLGRISSPKFRVCRTWRGVVKDLDNFSDL